MDLLKSFLLSVSVFMFVYWLWTRRNYYRFAWNFPGYLGWPIIGNFDRIKSWRNFMITFTKFFEETQKYTLCIWMGTHPSILTADPDFIEEIINKPDMLNKAKSIYTPLNDTFDGGIVTSPVEVWQVHRRLINPAFSHKVLLSFIPIFNKAKNFVTTKLTGYDDGKEHKLSGVITRLTLGITVETTMGHVMKEGDEVDETLSSTFEYMMESVIIWIMMTVLNIGSIFNLNQKFFTLKMKLQKFIEKLIMENIETRKKLTKEENNNIVKIDDINRDVDLIELKKKPQIFVEQILKLYDSKEFTWHDIIGESSTILSASFETTANAIFSTLVMLAMHPEVQERLFEEIVQVFPDKHFEMTYEHMSELPYLEMVLNEVLRLTPSIPVIGRQVTQDFRLRDGTVVPRGMQILISIFDLHRRKDIWGPDADKFNPDHFLPDNMQDKHNFAFMPFSKGVRNCIGWRYAMFALRVIVTGLVRNFRFSTSAKLEDLSFITYIALRYSVEPELKIEVRD